MIHKVKTLKEDLQMGAITKEIIRLKSENEKIKDDIVRFTRLKEY